MADNGEKTELPTGKRLDEASQRGQVPYSKELTSALMFLILLGGLRLWGDDLMTQLTDASRDSFTFASRQRLETGGVSEFIADLNQSVTAMLSPILLMVVAIVLVSGFVQVGVSFRFERIQARWGKLNPLQGVRKLLSMSSVFTVGLSILKVLAVGAIVWTTMSQTLPRAAALTHAGLAALSATFVDSIFTIGFRVGALVLLLGIIDLLWTRHRHVEGLKMSKEEVKEEGKEAEGSPEVKARIKSIQKEVARARMMKDVKSATVVVRNPTHYAVALRYDQGQDPSPRLVAKGRNHTALRIIEIAKEAGVPIRTEPPLAREIYRTVKLNQIIPEELFRAVARILAWVYRQKGQAVSP